jgi:hypothetical protein
LQRFIITAAQAVMLTIAENILPQNITPGLYDSWVNYDENTIPTK